MAPTKSTSVFPRHYLDQIVKTLTVRTAQALDKTRIWFTRDEFIDAFIIPEHREPLASVYELAGKGDESVRSITLQTSPMDTSKQLQAHLQFAKSPEMIVPKYIDYGTLANSAFAEKIRDWAAERRRMGLMVGDAIDALFYLNEACGNAKAFSLCFPALSAIMVRNVETNYNVTPRTYRDKTPEEAEKDPVIRRGHSIQNIVAIGTMPSLPREVVDQLRNASALVQILLMTEDAREDTGENTIGNIAAMRWDDPTKAPSTYARQNFLTPAFGTTSFN